MAKPLRLKLLTPYQAVFDGQVEAVIVPGEVGELGVLAGHTKFVTTLVPGIVRFVAEGRTRHAAVSGGFCEVSAEGVTVLADSLEMPEEIDVERAERARRSAEEALKKRAQLDEQEIRHQQARLARALNRLRAAKLAG